MIASETREERHRRRKRCDAIKVKKGVKNDKEKGQQGFFLKIAMVLARDQMDRFNKQLKRGRG